jgi:hypothetical protein
VELLQKPFEIDVLAEMVEGKGIYEELERINLKVKELRNFIVTHMQLVDLLAG